MWVQESLDSENVVLNISFQSPGDLGVWTLFIENDLSRKIEGFHYILNEEDRKIETFSKFLLFFYNTDYISIVKIVISDIFDAKILKMFLYAIEISSHSNFQLDDRLT